MTLPFFRLLLASLMLLAKATPTSGQAPPVDLRALDQRVAAIGHRLAVANLDLCADRQYLSGFLAHDLSQYGVDDRPSIRFLGLDAGPAVLALVPGGPAERAGLRLDDVLLSLEGQALPRGERLGHDGSFEVMVRILDAFDGAFADGVAEIGVRRGGGRVNVTVRAEPGCTSRFQMVSGRSLNARADGLYVQVTAGIAAFAADDQELAAVLAHEFAHNVLRHRVRLDAAGVSRGFFGNFGRSARRIRETEAEADRLAPYLLDRAGYDPEAAVRFWSRLGSRGLNFLGSSTHGSWRRRIETIEAEIAAIRRARAAGMVPRPGFVQLPLPPRPTR